MMTLCNDPLYRALSHVQNAEPAESCRLDPKPKSL